MSITFIQIEQESTDLAGRSIDFERIKKKQRNICYSYKRLKLRNIVGDFLILYAEYILAIEIAAFQV